ncbi:MAG: deoxyribose-phosphate aldolase [Actinomycetota bacterium]
MSITESDLARRAARLYYDDNKTQDEIGEILDITRWKVGRLLSLARDSGIVTISIADTETAHERAISGIIPTARSTAHGVTDSASLAAFLRRLPAVDAIGLEARAATLATRSIKNESKRAALDTIIRLIDLTTLEGADTPGKVKSLVAKALVPDSSDATTPRVAAVCVYPDMVEHAVAALGSAIGDGETGVSVASVATAFPSGRSTIDVKLADTRYAVAQGAGEIDMVIDRGAFLSGDLDTVFNEIVQVREACNRADGTHAHLKVILETGELRTYDNIKRASWLAILAGADFIKTSTGKVQPAATLPTTVLMLEVVRDWFALTGERIGVKPAGGIRQSKDAIRYLVAVAEVAGEEWLNPHLFRFGASSLLNDVLLQRQKMTTGHYSGPDYVTVD